MCRYLAFAKLCRCYGIRSSNTDTPQLLRCLQSSSSERSVGSRLSDVRSTPRMRALNASGCVLQQRQGLSTGLASSVSSSGCVCSTQRMRARVLQQRHGISTGLGACAALIDLAQPDLTPQQMAVLTACLLEPDHVLSALCRGPASMTTTAPESNMDELMVCPALLQRKDVSTKRQKATWTSSWCALLSCNEKIRSQISSTLLGALCRGPSSMTTTAPESNMDKLILRSAGFAFGLGCLTRAHGAPCALARKGCEHKTPECNMEEFMVCPAL